MFVRFSAMTGAPRIVYGDLGEAPAAGKAGDRATLFLQANAHVLGLDPDGTPYFADPRHILARALQPLADMGLTAPEITL